MEGFCPRKILVTKDFENGELKGHSHEIFHLNIFFSSWNRSAYVPDWNPSVNSNIVSNLWKCSNSNIFPRCCLQRWSFFYGVGNNTDHFSALWSTTQKNLSALWSTMWKNTRELRVDHFCMLYFTTQKSDRRCRQQCGIFSLLPTARKNVCHCGQQRWRFATIQYSKTYFVILYLPLKGQFT